MAYSIMDKSIAVLGKSMHPINVNETVPDSATPVKGECLSSKFLIYHQSSFWNNKQFTI